MNGAPFSVASIETVKGGFYVSGLSRHVKVLLACGKPFATIEWHWTRNRSPRASPNVYGRPLLRDPEGVMVEPAASEARLRRLFEECFGTGRSDWFDRCPHAAKGALRALLLKKLGAKIEIGKELIEHLSTGKFQDHFSDHWVQMFSMYPYLHHDHDWRWAARHLVPPRKATAAETERS